MIPAFFIFLLFYTLVMRRFDTYFTMPIPLSFRIALRYIFSKKSTNAINIISFISMIGMGAGAMFLVVILSVFNGFEGLVNKMYTAFYPDIKITATTGKTFEIDEKKMLAIRNVSGVQYAIKSLEENAYIQYENKDFIVTLKGVEEDFVRITGIDTFVLMGIWNLNYKGEASAVLGAAVDDIIQADMSVPMVRMKVMVPKKERAVYVNPEDAFNTDYILPVGAFAIQQDFDSKYVIVPYSFITQLTNNEERVGSIEIKLNKNVNQDKAQIALKKLLGSQFKVQNRIQQNASLYKVIRIERLAVYVILSFVLFVVSFNIIGSLSMLVMDKEKDIAILKAMGAKNSQIRIVFILVGVLSSIIGASVGILIGACVCFIQMQFGFIKLQGSGSFVVQAYPVEMQLFDFVMSLLIVFVISLLASLYPAYKATQRSFSLKYA